MKSPRLSVLRFVYQFTLRGGIATLLAAALVLPLVADEVVQVEGFEGGQGAARAYRGGEVIEVLRDGEMSFLRITPPGEKPLEGVRLPLNPLDGDRLMFATAKVRGRGTMGPMLQASNGWTRLPEVTLTEEWQEVTVPRALKAGVNHPILYFVSLSQEAIQRDALFEIADVRVTVAPPLDIAAREVAPIRYEMEEFSPSPSLIQDEDGVIAVFTSNPFISQSIAFPQTSLPVTAYLRYRPSSGSDRVQLSSTRGGTAQVIREEKPEGSEWRWIALPAITAEEAGEEIRITVWPGSESRQSAVIDALVFSTGEEMDSETLEAIR